MTEPLRIPPNKAGNITVIGNRTTIKNLMITNQDLADFLLSAAPEDQEELFIALIDTAIKVKNLASASADIAAFKAYDELFLERIKATGQSAFADLERVFKEQTDEDREGNLVDTFNRKFLPGLMAELSPLNEKSPFRPVYEQLQELQLRFAANAEAKRGTQHGRTFNTTMDGIVQKLAARSGDSALYVNDTLSEHGSKVGDEVVTVDLGNNQVKVVWEFKAENKVTQTAALTEIKDAMTNRDAQSGVFVLAKTAHNQNWAPFQQFPGRCCIVVVEEDNPDENLLQMAHLWARVEAMKTIGLTESDVDLDLIRSLIKSAETTLASFSTLKRNLTAIKTGYESATSTTDELESDLKSTFQKIIEATKP